MRTTILSAAGLVLIAVFVSGPMAPGRAAGQDQGNEKKEPPGARLPKPLVIPPEAHKRVNPVPAVPEAIEAGRVLYDSQCAMCHGAKGDGRGDLAVSFKLKMPDFTQHRAQSRRTDGDLFYIMSTGHGDMPGENRLVDQNKWEIVRYLRTLEAGPAKK